MTKHTTGTREKWLAARLELLKADKELTRRSDELARRLQELPWVRIEKDYHFEPDEGKASLGDLFRDRPGMSAFASRKASSTTPIPHMRAASIHSLEGHLWSFGTYDPW